MKAIKVKNDAELLESFLLEFFDFNSLCKAGFFTKEMRKDYSTQAAKLCHFFGYKTIYEYGATEFRCHISYADGHRPPNTPFVEVTKSIYE